MQWDVSRQNRIYEDRAFRIRAVDKCASINHRSAIHDSARPMGIKSEKTFEEIVERIVALGRPQTQSRHGSNGERNRPGYEQGPNSPPGPSTPLPLKNAPR